jgi:hypothetical protein
LTTTSLKCDGTRVLRKFHSNFRMDEQGRARAHEQARAHTTTMAWRTPFQPSRMPASIESFNKAIRQCVDLQRMTGALHSPCRSTVSPPHPGPSFPLIVTTAGASRSPFPRTEVPGLVAASGPGQDWAPAPPGSASSRARAGDPDRVAGCRPGLPSRHRVSPPTCLPGPLYGPPGSPPGPARPLPHTTRSARVPGRAPGLAVPRCGNPPAPPPKKNGGSPDL